MDNQTLLSLLSKKKLTNMQTKKYMAAYLDRNAKPNTTPRIIKLIKEGSFLIRKNTIKEICLAACATALKHTPSIIGTRIIRDNGIGMTKDELINSMLNFLKQLLS